MKRLIRPACYFAIMGWLCSRLPNAPTGELVLILICVVVISLAIIETL